MIIFKRELKRNFKYFTIWTALMCLMFIYMAVLYPTMMEQSGAMEKMLEGFPEGLIKAFNFDLISNFKDVTYFFASEPFVLWLLCGSIFAMLLASGILSKEESDKTIEFLLSKPVTRNNIINQKLLSTTFYILLFNIIPCITTFLTFEAIEKQEFSRYEMLLLFIAAFLVQLTFAAVGFLISVFIKKTKNALPLSIGVVLGTYILNVFAGMTEKTEGLKYLTPFKYAEARDILQDSSMNAVYLIIISVVIIASIVLSYVFYNRKDIGT